MSASAKLDAQFAALSDPTRRAIVERLARGETTVGELAKPHDITLPAISKHISVLEDAGIVVRWRDGRVHKCRLEPGALDGPDRWLDRTRAHWEKSLDRLERMIIDEAREARRP